MGFRNWLKVTKPETPRYATEVYQNSVQVPIEPFNMSPRFFMNNGSFLGRTESMGVLEPVVNQAGSKQWIVIVNKRG